MPAALFGITNDALNLVVNLLILFLVVLWLALVAWTYFDARRRIADPILVASATAASLFPFLGTIVYSILRPPEFLADKRERELEIRASELRVRQLEEASCPNCEHPVERTFLRCPNCRARIKDPCESCGKPIDPRWSICPYCETPQRRAAPPERRPSRPASGAAKAPSASEAPPKSSRSTSTKTAEPADEPHHEPLELRLADEHAAARRRARPRAGARARPPAVELALAAQRAAAAPPAARARPARASAASSTRAASCRLPRRWPRTRAP